MIIRRKWDNDTTKNISGEISRKVMRERAKAKVGDSDEKMEASCDLFLEAVNKV